MATSRSDAAGAAAGAAAGGADGPSVPFAAVHDTDVAVIGAGPAGLAAAVAAADGGVRVVLIDAEPVVGGQFWRHPAAGSDLGAAEGDVPGPPDGPVTDREVAPLHHDLRRYRRLRRRLSRHVAAGDVTHLARHEVWAVQRRSAPSGAEGDPTGAEIFAAACEMTIGDMEVPETTAFDVLAATGDAAGRRTVTVRARTLVLATGAYDLQVPFPGWDLPGVLTAGGVQSLLKGHAVLAGQRVVVAGTGPFLMSVAAGLVRSGASLGGVFEAARPGRWLRELRGVLAAGPKILEGAGYAGDLARRRVGYHTGWTVLSAEGDEHLETVTVAPLSRAGTPDTDRARVMPADVLAVGWGFVPNLEMALMLDCDIAPGNSGLPVVLVDADQATTVPGVYAAGEVCGVGGAALAAVEGEIAGAAAAVALGAGPTGFDLPGGPAGLRRRQLDRRRATLRTFADALARVYPVPASWLALVRDDTVVCRCEEVAAGVIREVARRDGADARIAKLLVRPGMGWCQGRICGYATECLVSDAAGVSAEHRAVQRPVAVPVPLGLVAGNRRTPGNAASRDDR